MKQKDEWEHKTDKEMEKKGRGEGENEEGAGENRAVIQTPNHMSRDLFTNWAGEKSLAPLRWGRLGGLGNRKHIGCSGECVVFFVFSDRRCQARWCEEDSLMPLTAWIGYIYVVSLWLLCAKAHLFLCYWGKRSIVRDYLEGDTGGPEESGWGQQRKGEPCDSVLKGSIL